MAQKYKTEATSAYQPYSVAGIIAAHQKAWDDIVKNDPVLKVKTYTTSAMQLPGGAISATTSPLTSYQPNPTPHQINSSVVADKWLTAGPSEEIKAQYGNPYGGDLLHLQSPGSFIGSIFHKMNQIASGFKAAVIESGREVGKGEHDLGKDIGSIFSGFKHGWEGTSDTRYSDLLHAGERTPTSDDHNLGWRILDSAANFTGDTLFSPYNFIPLGAPTRLAIKGVKAGVKAIKKTPHTPVPTPTPTITPTPIPTPPNMNPGRFGPGAGNAGGGKFGPGPTPPAPTGPRPGPGPNIPPVAPGGAGIPTPPVPPPPMPITNPAAAVTATAATAQHAAISDQLHNFHPPEAIQTHITQTAENVPHAPVASHAAANETIAASDLEAALPTNAPVSEALYTTLANAQTKAPAVVFHPTLGELDLPKLDFHIKQASTDYNAAYRFNARLRKEPLTPEVNTQILNAQKMMKDARVQINELKKLKKSMPVEARNGPVGQTNPAAQVKPETIRPPEPAPEPVNPPVEPITPEPVQGPSQSASGPPSRPKAEIQADIDKSLVALQKATDRVNAAEERGNAANIAKANDNFDRIALQHETFRTEMENFREAPVAAAGIRDRAAIEADVTRLKAESDKAQETLAKAYKSGDHGKIMNAQTRADMADEAHQAVEKELAAFKPVSEQMMPTPKQVTENQIAEAAHENLATGNHLPAPEPEVAKAAIAAERKIKSTDGRLAVNKFGRAKMAGDKRDPATGRKATTPDRVLKYANTADQARAYQEAFSAVLDKLPRDLVDEERVNAAHKLLWPMLEKHKLDSHEQGFISRLGNDARVATMRHDDYLLHHADVYEVAVKHDPNIYFLTAPSYEAARNTVVPQGSQLVAAVKALDLENAPISHTEKVAEIVDAMKAAGEKSTFKLEREPLESFANAMIRGTSDLRNKIAENEAGIYHKIKADTQTIKSQADKDLEDNIVGPNASNTSALHAMADMAANVHRIADDIGAHPAAAQAAAAGHGVYAAQHGINDVEVNEARTILGNRRIINSAPLNSNGSFSRGVRSKVDNRIMQQGRLRDAQTDAQVNQMLNVPSTGKYSGSNAVPPVPPASAGAGGGGGGGIPPGTFPHGNIPPHGGTPGPGSPAVQRAQYNDSIDIGQRTDYRTFARAVAAMGDSAKSGFKRGDPNSGVETAKDVVRKAKGRADALVGDIRKHIRNTRKQYKNDPGSHQIAMKALQTGTVPDPQLNPNAAGIYNDIKLFMSKMFEVQPNANQHLGTMFTSGHSWDEINSELEKMGIDKRFRFDVNKAAGLPPHQANDAIASQWKDWDFGVDPLSRIDELYSAMASMKALKDAAMQAKDYFGSPVRTATHTHRVHNSRSSQYISKYIGTDTYFPEKIATQLGDIEAGLRRGTRFSNKNAAGKLMNSTIIPLTNSLKISMTIIKPAFVLRNTLGDGLISHMADGVGPKHYMLSRQIMSSVGQASKTAKDILADASGNAAHSTKDAMTITLKGGKTIKMSVDDLRKMHVKEGMLQRYHASDAVAEDLLSGGRQEYSAVGKFANKINNSTPIRKASELQDWSSSFTRMAHMNKLMSDPKFTSRFATLEEAAGKASSRVRFYHPDPGSLTNFEARWARQLIPFYTWQRSIILPTMLSMVNNPKNFMQFTYAKEAANTIAGSNQGNIGDPSNQWDTDTIRPDYVLSNLFGAEGNMFGIVRGIIGGGGDTPGSQSIGADYGSGWENLFGATGLLTGTNHGDTGLGGVLKALPGKVYGQAAPAIQLAAAALTHKTITENGLEPISSANVSDFIDKMIPGINQIANISGYSPSGTLGNLLTGNTSAGSVLAPQESVLKGNKRPFANISTLNFFSPVKLSDPNTPTNSQVALKRLLEREGVG